MVEEQTKADERWASRGIAAMLIHEIKDYKAAADSRGRIRLRGCLRDVLTSDR